MPEPTPYAELLINELIKRGLNIRPEYFDGHKSVDIYFPDVNIDLEIDGGHHNSDYKTALSDLRRTVYSMKEGRKVIRIPNTLIYNGTKACADLIERIIDNEKNQIKIKPKEFKKSNKKIKQSNVSNLNTNQTEELTLFLKSVKKEFEVILKENYRLIEQRKKNEEQIRLNQIRIEQERKQKERDEELRRKQIKKIITTSTFVIGLLLIGVAFYFDIPEFNFNNDNLIDEPTEDVNIKNTINENKNIQVINDNPNNIEIEPVKPQIIEPTQIPTIEDDKLRFYDFKKDGVYDTFKVFNKLNNDLTINVFYKQSVNKRGNPTVYHESQRTITIPSQQFITLQGESGYNSPYNTQIVKESISYEIVN